MILNLARSVLIMGGFGAMMRGVRNKVVSAAKSTLDEGAQATKTMAGDVAQDVLLGENLKDSLQKRTVEQRRRMYAGVTPTSGSSSSSIKGDSSPTSGQGCPQRRRRRRTNPKRKTAKRKKTDIFDDYEWPV